ncbi:MAG: saccharopine dehydrogenase NADP-binding domain-containing protein [Candidatus Aenigmarchaeota archaeon]|nr:saccharopine dehydrogenase NADP-binding domain-containing protein [Candidatus Aenigmarchaeota archaeon]
MKRIVVLGGTGNIGRWVVRDLYDSCKDCEIVIAAKDSKKAGEYAKKFKSSRVKSAGVDVTDINKTAKLLKGADVCINCVIYYLNLHVMKACLRTKCHYLDLGGLFHMTRKQLKLHKQFKNKNILAILGCGSTPGITNVLAAYGARFFDSIHEIHISFADADFTKYDQPFVLPYTMYTLFDEYMMKPPLFTKGKLKIVEPRSGETRIEFPKPTGKIKGFYTIHSELATIPKSFKGVKECSFRVTFPEEFSRKMEFLIDAGFASDKEIGIGKSKIKPRDFTAKIMDRWIPKDVKVKDIECLRVEMKGKKSGRKKQLIGYCLTKSNKKYNIPAGTYDTAVPPSIIAQMITGGKISKRGVLPPEKCIEPGYFLRELRKRGIRVFVRKK